MLALTLMLILCVDGAIKTKVFLPNVNDMNCILHRSGELSYDRNLHKLTKIERRYYRPQRSWGKVIFSEACVKNSVHGGGRAWQGGAWWGGGSVCGRGHVWWGACMAGGVCGRGACMADTMRYSQ